MAEGDRTSGGDPTGPGERDLLAERRLRRVEQGDPALIRRAQDAEATVRTLEGHLADLRRSLREAEAEQRRTAEQLAAREHEVRRVKQREYAEQQLRVEAEEQRERLEREQRGELDRLQRRLAAGERHARELADRLETVRRELSEAEQAAATGRAAARRAELQLTEREADLTRRELVLEQRLDGMRRSHAKMELIVRELKSLALQLRSTLGSGGGGEGLKGGEARGSNPAPRHARAEAPVREEPDESAREEMAKALAAAVERLRARVTAVSELRQEPPPQASAFPAEPPVTPVAPPASSAEPPAPSVEPATPLAESPASPVEQRPQAAPTPAPFVPRVLALTAQRPSWLAPAIRRVAQGRDAKLAGELICELLPAQRLVVKKALAYTLRIEGLGEVQVRLDGERATVRRPSVEGLALAAGSKHGDFLLEGSAAAFAELAAGGAGRRMPEVRMRGSRRRLRRLLARRRQPLALSDLAEADIPVWPGLLLLALSEAIDPEWTLGHGFVLAFVIQSPPASPSATLYAQMRDGEPIAVTRVRGERPVSIVHLSERAFLCMLAGAPLPPGEQVLLEGPTEPLTLLLGWSDRAQGLAR